jgi:hypothetical protein
MWIAPHDEAKGTDRHDTMLLGFNDHQFQPHPAAIPLFKKAELSDGHHTDQAGGVDHRLSIQPLTISERK